MIQVKSLDFDSLKELFKKENYQVDVNSLDDKGWNLSKLVIKNIFNKLKDTTVKLDEFLKGNIYRGISSGLDKAFVIDEETKNVLIKNDSKSAEFIKPYLVGKDIRRYNVNNRNVFVIYVPWNFEINKYKSIKEHLEKFKSDLASRPEVKQGRFPWYAMSRYASDYYHVFEKPKILYLKFQVKPAFTFDVNCFFTNSAVWMIPGNDFALLGLLNSKLGWFLISNYCSEIQGGYQLIYEYLKEIPIPKSLDP